MGKKDWKINISQGFFRETFILDFVAGLTKLVSEAYIKWILHFKCNLNQDFPAFCEEKWQLYGISQQVSLWSMPIHRMYNYTYHLYWYYYILFFTCKDVIWKCNSSGNKFGKDGCQHGSKTGYSRFLVSAKTDTICCCWLTRKHPLKIHPRWPADIK